MVLDPLTALAIAGSIVQFVDFSSKLLAKGHELYAAVDGASIGYSELETIARDLNALNDRLQQCLPSQQHDPTQPDSEAGLRRLSAQCSVVAGELVPALEGLKVQGTANRRWKSFRQALKCMMKKEEVNAIATRLQCLRDELNLHILVSIRYGVGFQILLSKLFNSRGNCRANFVSLPQRYPRYAINKTDRRIP
jgi:hypothetical protein